MLVTLKNGFVYKVKASFTVLFSESQAAVITEDHVVVLFHPNEILSIKEAA